jgi:translation elongation factor EF-1alpha
MDKEEYRIALRLANKLIAELTTWDSSLNYTQIIRMAIFTVNKMKATDYDHYKYDNAIDILKDQLK